MLYDISPLISEHLSVWPGDTPPGREVLLDMAQGAPISLSTLRATVHLGAHADAPSHYGLGAPAIHERRIDVYVGPCELVRVRAKRNRCLEPADLPEQIQSPRVLIDTGTYPDPSQFNIDFAALSPALVEFLHERAAILVGTDAPSVDPFDSKELLAHKTFLRYDMAILEGLVLKDVPEGSYELIALPLRLEGFDASPVRAVLRTI
jgi:arylformamidase